MFLFNNLNEYKTFLLTKGLDNVPGTSGNDTIIGSIASSTTDPELNTLSALDIINGGAGVDTLKIADNVGAAIALPNVSNVEVIEVQGAKNVEIDTSTLTGVTNLNVTKAATDGGAKDAVKATAAATTDINVSMKAAGDTVAVIGGKNVTVKLTDVDGIADIVDVGTGTQAKGDVVVEMTGKAATATAALSAVTTTGGKTVSVTQKATSDASAIATNKVAATITQGAVTVTGNADTTTVTVKQDASVNAVAAVDAVAAKAATQEVTFSAMTKGQILSLDFGAGALTFTANKDLTAAEAASAFANLAKDAKQGNAAASLGIYTDANADAGATTTTGVSDGWTSGAVQTVSDTQSKVVFSNAAANPTAISNNALVTTATAPAAGGVNAGTAAVAAKTGVLGVTNGAVGVTDANGTIKTITVDGYANSTTTTTTVLETLNLSNSGLTYGAGKVTAAAGITVADTAATLALNLEKVGFSGYYNGDATTTTEAAVVTLTAAPTTLNVKSTGNNYVNLTAAATETLNVSGTGTLNLGVTGATTDLAGLKAVKVTETAGLVLNGAENDTLDSVDTTGTTGTVTVTINGDKATYAGGAGVDKVTVANANTAISKTIDLGAGDDTLTLDVTGGAVAVPTVEIKGGDGTDTIAMAGADAIALSANGDFAAKISGFEKLNINAAPAAPGTVDMSNMDGISYVISANSTAAAAATEFNAITFKALAPGQSVTVDGLTLTASAGALTGAQVAAAFDSLAASTTAAVAAAAPGGNVGTFTGALSANWSSGAAGSDEVTFTSTTPNADVANLVTVVNAIGTSPVDVTKDDTTVDLTEFAEVTFVNGAVNETVTVAGRTLTINDVGGMTAAEIEAAFATGATTKGTFDTALVGWTVAGANGNDGDGKLTFTSTTLNRNVTDITVADTIATGNASAATTQGYAASTLTFKDLAIGQSVTVDGLTLTATTAAITAANVAAGFDSLAASTASGAAPAVTGGTWSGALSANWASQAAAGAAVEFRSATAGTLEAALVVTDLGVPAGTALGVAPTPGVNAGGTMTLDKLANNGTLELTAAGGGVVVKIVDATTGTADVLNIVANAVTGADLGLVTAAKVETINIEAKDTDTTVTALGVANVSTNTIKLDADAAKTVTIKGDGNLVLDLSATASTKEVTLVDGSTATGKLTLTTLAGDTAATTVKGGSAADTLTAKGANDVLIGGAGNDTLKVDGNVASAVKLTGGDGVDLFDVSTFRAANAGAAVTIEDLAKGESIKFASNVNANFASSKVTLIGEATFDNYVSEAAKQADLVSGGTHGIAWFQYGTNTFIVQDVNGDAAFSANADIIVKLTGLVDLSASSFNEVGQGTLLFI